MGVLAYPDFMQRLTPYESSVRSTALAHRFMVRRRLAQFRGASAVKEEQAARDGESRPAPAPRQNLVRQI